jgi:vacuolar-type H+-ATPase subunit F/Vma7
MDERAPDRSLPVYIGDEVSAAGFRLAGLRVRTPGAGTVTQLLEQAVLEASLVLVSAQMARQVPPAVLDRLLAAIEPCVIIIPDVYGDTPMPDLGVRIRSQLGVLE